MLIDPGSLAAGSAVVTGAIRQASQATGTSFSYLLATAQVESGLNPHAGASTSSARGLFQFVEQTWLGTMKQAGAGLGYGRYADAITRTASGRYEVTDPTMRQEILKLRNDPVANAVMAGAFTKANANYLAQKLGRQPSDGELYIAHFLGAGGAAKLIQLAASNPDAKATEYFANAANANPSIFFDRKTGAARSLAGVRDVLIGRYDIARSLPDRNASVAQATNNPAGANNPAAPLSIVPDTAGIANAYAAANAPTKAQGPVASKQVGHIFHGLFQDTDRAAPVAAVVSQLWGASSGVPVKADASAPATNPAAVLDLFRDPAKGS